MSTIHRNELPSARDVRVHESQDHRWIPPGDPAHASALVLLRATEAKKPLAWVDQDGRVTLVPLAPEELQTELENGLRRARETASSPPGYIAYGPEASLRDVLVALVTEVGRLRWELERVKTERS